MSDPNRPGPGRQPYHDPAYASPPAGQQWYQQPPTGAPTQRVGSEPPKPPKKSPRWLFVVAGVAVLLVAAMAIALVIANNSANKSTTDTASNGTPTARATFSTPSLAPSATTKTTSPVSPTSPTETTSSGGTETVVYSVTGEGQATSIAYMDTGGTLKTEFNVSLPWSQEVTLTSDESDSATVTVFSTGKEVTCTLTVNGSQVSEHSGSLVVLCSSATG